jgi:hypothetical protein
MAEPEQRPGPSTGEVGDWIHYAIAFVLAFYRRASRNCFPVMYYGILLFIAGILVGGYSGWVIAEKFVSLFLIVERIIS